MSERTDTERLDWLDQNREKMTAHDGYAKRWWTVTNISTRLGDIRLAIDAAMEGET